MPGSTPSDVKWTMDRRHGNPPMLLDVLERMRKRLKRRNILLDEVRNAYLQDVVVVRNLLTRTGRDQSELKRSAKTTLNIKRALELYAPSECTFAVKHGTSTDKFGGHVEVIHHESKRVAELSKRIEELLKLEQESRFRATKFEVQAQEHRAALRAQQIHNQNEREQLCTRLKILKERLDGFDEKALETAQHMISKLQRNLEFAEAKIDSLVPLVDHATSNQQEASQAGLMLAGKDHRIGELGKLLVNAKNDLCQELKKSSDLEKNMNTKIAEIEKLQTKYTEIYLELDNAKAQCQFTQAQLDESHRCEAELKQKLSDLHVEYTEAMQREEAEQEELRLLQRDTRGQLESVSQQLDTVKRQLSKSELSKGEAVSKARIEVEKQMNDKFQFDKRQLQDELVRSDEKQIKSDAKLKLEQKKRATIDAELRALQIERHTNFQVATESNKKLKAKLDEIFSLVGLTSDMLDRQDSYETRVEQLKERIAALLSNIDQLEEKNFSLDAHLNQYKMRSEAASSSAQLIPRVPTHKTSKISPENETHMTPERASAFSELQMEFQTIVADRVRLEAELKIKHECLETTKVELRKAIIEDEDARYINTIALSDLSKKLHSEFESGLVLSQRSIDAVGAANSSGQRIQVLELEMSRFGSVTLDDRKEPKHPVAATERLENQLQRNSIDSSDLGTKVGVGEPVFREKIISIVTVLADELQKARELEVSAVSDSPPILAANADNREAISHLSLLSTALSSALDNVFVELRALRASTNTLPKNFSYTETLAKIEMLEQLVKEPGDTDTGKKGGREEEVQRLKQRNASQQNFIIELQEEIATTKGQIFAADETRRQHADLEERYRLLENEFTEKAENEVNSRKAKERIELQLTLAHADIASLSRAKETLAAEMKNIENQLSKLELKLMQTQGAYEDQMQHERMRLETNRDVGIQYSPTPVEIQVQTSFKTPGMTLRQMNSFDHVPHRKRGPGLVTPANTADTSSQMHTSGVRFDGMI